MGVYDPHYLWVFMTHIIYGCLAQLDRATDFGSVGWLGFKSPNTLAFEKGIWVLALLKTLLAEKVSL